MPFHVLQDRSVRQARVTIVNANHVQRDIIAQSTRRRDCHVCPVSMPQKACPRAWTLHLGPSQRALDFLNTKIALPVIIVQQLLLTPKPAQSAPIAGRKVALHRMTVLHAKWARLETSQALQNASAAERATAARKEQSLNQTAARPLLLYHKKYTPKS